MSHTAAVDPPRTRRRLTPDQAVWLLVAVGFVLRIVWVVAAHRPARVGDPVAYVFHGDQLSRGLGYNNHGVAMLQLKGGIPPGELPPTAFYAIGYPLFLALVFRIVRAFGGDGTYETYATVYALVYGVVHAFVGAATISLVARIARRVVSPRAAVTAAALVALWPNLIGYTASANLETVYMFLLAAAILVVLPALEAASASATRLVAAGTILGAAAQVRPLVAFAMPGVLLAFRRRPEPWRVAIAHTLVVTATMIAIIVPWTIRNAVVMPEPVLVTTGTGDALCMSRYPGSNGRFVFNSPGCDNEAGHLSAVDEIDRNRVNTERALRFVREHPVEEVKLWFRRARAAFRDDHESRLALEEAVDGRYVDPIWPNSRARHAADLVADAWYYAVLALALVAFPSFLRGRRAGPVLVVGVVVAAAVVPIMLFGDPRYKVPMLPFLAVIAAHGLCRTTRSNPDGAT